MPLLQYLYQSLASFRQVYPRQRTFVLFCAVLLGFIGVTQMSGVTSLCRWWQLGEPGYHSLLHFFHSAGWTAGSLALHWQSFVLERAPLLRQSGRLVLVGDHLYAIKDGRRMPGVVTLHQDSETQSRPSYFRGHHWGVLGALCGSVPRAFCLPLGAAIHQGFAHLGGQEQEGQAKKTNTETLGTRLVRMALSFAVKNTQPCILVLDAFFSTGPVFALADSVWSTRLKQPYLHILTRAKKSYVAYRKAEQPQKRGRGRPRVYGGKIKLIEVFETHRGEFRSRACLVYGKSESVAYFTLNLLWKPLKREVRFIFARTSRGPIILMSSNLHLHAKTAIELYSSRVRIETLFWVLKHVLGAFRYRFWSKRLPRHSRKPVKNTELKVPPAEALPAVAQCWEAYERFVLIAIMAAGMLQLLSLRFSTSVWVRFTGYLRTRSRPLPSERTVKEVVSRMLVEDYHQVAPSRTMQEIQAVLHSSSELSGDEEAAA